MCISIASKLSKLAWTEKGENLPALYIDGLVQDYSNSSALAIMLLQSCTKPYA